MLGLILIPEAFALDPGKHITQYGHTAWRIEDGVLPGQPMALAQTRDGYLWIGTRSGLVQFDGVKFVPFPDASGEPLRSSLILSLLADRDGSLWIGTIDGVEHSLDGHLTHYPQRSFGTFGYVQSIIQSRDGVIWLNREPTSHEHVGALCSIQGGTLRCFNQQDGVDLATGLDVLEDKDGSLWTHDYSTLIHWDPRNHRVLPGGLSGLGEYRSFQRIILDTDGSVLMAMNQSGSRPGLAHARNGRIEPFKAGSFDAYRIAAMTVLRDSRGSLWIGTDAEGIYRVSGTQVDHYTKSEGLSNDSINAIFEDRESNIWVATKMGVDRFRDVVPYTYSVHEGLSNNEVCAVLAGGDGTIWINNLDSLDALHPDGTVTSLRAGKELPGAVVGSLMEDHKKRLWVGIDNGLQIFDGHVFKKLQRRDGQPIGRVKTAVEDRDGDVWAVTTSPSPLGALLHFAADELLEEIQHDQLPLAQAAYVVADPRGGIWVPVDDDKLAHWNHGHAEFIDLRSSSSSHASTPTGLVMRPDGTLIESTTAGLAVIRGGHVRTLSVGHGLPCLSIWGLTDTSEALWLSSECGAIELRYSELEHWWNDSGVRLRTRVVGPLDGVQMSMTNTFPRATHSADGRVWFANDIALQMIDPRASPVQPVRLAPVHIEKLVADGKAYPLAGEVDLPVLVGDVRIDYTSPSFAAPQRVVFRYRLDGLGDKWVDAGNRRQVSFNNLRPGVYRFRVKAGAGTMPWSDAESVVEFRVPPRFYQTSWFMLLVVGATLALVYLLYTARINAIKRGLRAQLQVRLDERERIARDLHDTLFQDIQGVLLAIDNSTNKLAAADPARQELKQALLRSDQVIADSRERVLELRAEDVERRSIGTALNRVGNDLGTLYERGPGLRVIELGTEELLHPIVFEEVFRIGREALLNAFRHSGAERIETEILFAREGMLIRITDNGVGIDERMLGEGGKPGHFGLRGMFERAQRVGAKLTIRSKPGAGTEVELSIARAVAIESRSRGWRWPWARVPLRPQIPIGLAGSPRQRSS
jgi:signal transduction histidine kinase/ligand-binding sensor domain-containing protein